MRKNIGLLVFAMLVLSPFAFLATDASAQRDLPPNRPAKGLIYDGLEVPHDGSCKGAYHVKAVTKGRPVCSHGPDAVPATMSMSAVAPVTTTQIRVEPGNDRLLRGKTLVGKIGKSRCYEAPAEGLRTLVALGMLREKVLKPVLRNRNLQGPPPHSHDPVDHHYYNLRQEMRRLFKTLKINT